MYGAAYQEGKALLEKGDYEEALEKLRSCETYKDSQALINEAHYQIGDAALEEKDYEKAADHFATCMNDSDARDKYKESYYQLAEKEFSKKNYWSAAQHYGSTGDYLDAKDKQLKAQFLYLQDKANSGQTVSGTDRSILNDLVAANYSGAEALKKKLFAWKATVYFNNSRNGTDSRTSMTVYDTWYAHVTLSGGDGGSVRLHYTIKHPNGQSRQSEWENPWYTGGTGWASTGYATPTRYAPTGKLTIYIYDDDNNLIGSGSVNITL